MWGYATVKEASELVDVEVRMCWGVEQVFNLGGEIEKKCGSYDLNREAFLSQL